jgi:hypothetical protein
MADLENNVSVCPRSEVLFCRLMKIMPRNSRG